MRHVATSEAAVDPATTMASLEVAVTARRVRRPRKRPRRPARLRPNHPHRRQNSVARRIRPLRRRSSRCPNHLLKPKSPLRRAAAPPLHQLLLPVARWGPRPDHIRQRSAARLPHRRSR
jgi:hypothetical protein